jgi:hypothetical protein
MVSVPGEPRVVEGDDLGVKEGLVTLPASGVSLFVVLGRASLIQAVNQSPM